MGNDSSKGLSQSEIYTLKESTQFTGKEIREWYEKFHSDYPSGFIAKDQFISMYQRMFPDGDASTFAEHIFNAYDQDGNGVIDFKEFLVTLNVTSKGTLDDKLRWTFRLYDLDGNGTIQKQEAVEIIQAIYKMRGSGNKATAEEAALRVFMSIDKNQDSKISEDEFVWGVKHSRDVLNLISTG